MDPWQLRGLYSGSCALARIVHGGVVAGFVRTRRRSGPSARWRFIWVVRLLCQLRTGPVRGSWPTIGRQVQPSGRIERCTPAAFHVRHRFVLCRVTDPAVPFLAIGGSIRGER